MVARVWKGITTSNNADAYIEFLTTELMAELKELPGYCKMQIMKQNIGDITEFTTQIFFENLDSIKQFAGEDYERAHIPAKAAGLLQSYNEKVAHYEVVL